MSHQRRRGDGETWTSASLLCPQQWLGQTLLVQLRTCPGTHPAPLPEAGSPSVPQANVPHQGSIVARRGFQGGNRVLGAHRPVPQPHQRLKMPWVRAWPHAATGAGANRNRVQSAGIPPRDFSPWLQMDKRKSWPEGFAKSVTFFILREI